MSERRRPGDGDPDATVMIPGSGAGTAPDPDGTVMLPAQEPDPDATVAFRPAAEPDPDATIAIRSQPPAQEPDPDATVALRPSPEPAEPDPDATIAIPTPGRKRDATPVPAAATAPGEVASLGGLNPLIEAANPILAVVPQIRHALRHPSPDGLRSSLVEGLEKFDAAARPGAGDAATSASIALCALLDESVSCTPWGAQWRSLLDERHSIAEGGAEFFALLEKAEQDPGANLELLEFLYVCLALGFEGVHRNAADGREKLAEVRARLRERIREFRPAHDGELSGRWRGVVAPAKRAPGVLGLWAAGSGVALALLAIYLAFSVSLGTRSDPVARDIAQLRLPAPEALVARSTAAAAAANAPALDKLLAAEIGRDEVAVARGAGQSTIVIRSDKLFASGSARLEKSLEPLLLRLAEALDQAPGSILVTGHTDDVPIRTARFPSNWELSQERARSVVQLMSARLKDPSRVSAEGLADSEPVAPNDSAANRARNRRVTLILKGGS